MHTKIKGRDVFQKNPFSYDIPFHSILIFYSDPIYIHQVVLLIFNYFKFLIEIYLIKVTLVNFYKDVKT